MNPTLFPCLCGFIANSHSTMKRHRHECEIWKNRDKKLIKLNRQIQTYKSRYGGNVSNAMHIDKVKEKHESTCLEKYNSKQIFSSDSILYEKVQRNNLKSHLEKQYWKSRKKKRNNKLIKFSFNNVMINESKWSNEINNFLDNYHYAKKGRNSKIIYSVSINDKLIGVIKFASVIRMEVATTLNFNHREILELDRFCIHPSYHKRNFASWLISRIIKNIKSDHKDIKCLVSFSDLGQGHDGAMYKASNWKLIWKTAESYIYINRNGEQINKKTLYNKAVKSKMTEREYAENLQLFKIGLPPKLKFIYQL